MSASEAGSRGARPSIDRRYRFATLLPLPFRDSTVLTVYRLGGSVLRVGPVRRTGRPDPRPVPEPRRSVMGTSGQTARTTESARRPHGRRATDRHACLTTRHGHQLPPRAAHVRSFHRSTEWLSRWLGDTRREARHRDKAMSNAGLCAGWSRDRQAVTPLAYGQRACGGHNRNNDGPTSGTEAGTMLTGGNGVRG